jgi:lipopolysaccharide/colanic/teichoic acid biosynthesis glycosyltransferase
MTLVRRTRVLRTRPTPTRNRVRIFTVDIEPSTIEQKPIESIATVAYPVSTARSPYPAYEAYKRALDIAASMAILSVIGPFLVAIMAAIAISYRTNPIYVQKRVGHLGKEFRMFKIKSMRDGSDKVVPFHLNETGGPTFKSAVDPRITPIGRFIRRTSIDEMPQVVNVLLGQMTLVGPRPPLASEVALYTPAMMHRLRVKPGITCIWQVSGRSDIQFRRWMAMDRLYVRKRGLRLDLYLLLLTPWAVLTMRGAR